MYHHVNSGCLLSWVPYYRLSSVSAQLLPEQGWAISSELWSPGRCTTSLPTFIPEWIWDNHSRGICFVWNNIFEPQESSAQLIPELSVMTVSPGKASSGEKVSDVCTGQGRPFFFSQCQKARWGERARHMSRVALSHSDPQMQFGPLFLLVEVRAAFESSELKMRAGLIRNTETNPVYWGYRTVRVQSCLNPMYCSVNFILWMDMP